MPVSSAFASSVLVSSPLASLSDEPPSAGDASCCSPSCLAVISMLISFFAPGLVFLGHAITLPSSCSGW